MHAYLVRPCRQIPFFYLFFSLVVTIYYFLMVLQPTTKVLSCVNPSDLFLDKILYSIYFLKVCMYICIYFQTSLCIQTVAIRF